MDGRAQLLSLARDITGSGDVEAAWAGTGPSVDVRKSCGICGEEQPVRIPFLRHVCRSCTAIWVPGICVDCAHTSVTFTIDGQLSTFATCGCSGRLRQLAYVPKARLAVDPEVAAARLVVVAKSHSRAKWMWRSALVVIAALAVVGGWRLVSDQHAGPAAGPATAQPANLGDNPSLPMDDRGRLAAARLRERGEFHDVFACAAELPAAVPALPGTAGVSPEGADAGSKAFLAGCLTG